MPVQQHISSYAHTGNIEGTGESTIGSNKSAVSLGKGSENGIGIDTNKQIDPSLNPFSSEGGLPWNGQPDIQLEVFDGDAEGLYIEYQNGEENKKEEDSEEGYIKGIYIERGSISLDDPIINRLLQMLSDTSTPSDQKLDLWAAWFVPVLGKTSTAMRWHRLEILTTQWCETGGSRV